MENAWRLGRDEAGSLLSENLEQASWMLKLRVGRY